MFAIAFDMTVAEVERLHPRSVPTAYAEIGRVLSRNGFEWTQGSVWVNPKGGLVELFTVMNELKALPWFPSAVREIRAFRLENNSDFTAIIKR